MRSLMSRFPFDVSPRLNSHARIPVIPISAKSGSLLRCGLRLARFYLLALAAETSLYIRMYSPYTNHDRYLRPCTDPKSGEAKAIE